MLPQLLPNVGYLLEQAETVIEEKADYQKQWLVTVGGVLINLYELEDFAIIAQEKVLYTVHKAWPDLSRDATYKWDYEFVNWAKAFSKRRGLEPAEETIDNKVTVYRDWIAEPVIEFPKEVKIPERDESGKETGNIIKMPFNPEQCDYSKRLIARAAAKEGRLNEQAWSALMDPYQTVRQLKRAMGETNKSANEDDLKFFQKDGIILASKFNHTIEVLAPLVEHFDDPLFREAVAHVFGVLGIPIPAELTK